MTLESRIFSTILCLLLVGVISATLPGTTSISVLFGDGIIKILGFILFFFGLYNIKRFILGKGVISVLILLLALAYYKVVRETNFDEHTLTPLLSTIWLCIIILYLKNFFRLRLFLLLLGIVFMINVFQPGIDYIFDINRNLSYLKARQTIQGFTVSYIIFCSISVPAGFIFIGLAQTSRNLIYRVLYFFLFITCLVATVTSGSRGGTIVILLGLIFFIYKYYKIFKPQTIKLKTVIFIIISSLLIFIFYWELVISSLLREDFTGHSTALRLFIYKENFNFFLDSPFFGAGWDKSVQLYGLTTHSGWLQALAELGFVGFLLELFALIKVFAISNNSIIKNFALKNINLVWLQISIQSALFSFVCWMFVENFSLSLGSRIIYILIGLLLCSSLIKNKSKLSIQ